MTVACEPDEARTLPHGRVSSISISSHPRVKCNNIRTSKHSNNSKFRQNYQSSDKPIKTQSTLNILIQVNSSKHQKSNTMPYVYQGMMPAMTANNGFPVSTRRSSKKSETSTLRSDSSSMNEKKEAQVSWTEAKDKDGQPKKSTLSRIAQAIKKIEPPEPVIQAGRREGMMPAWSR